MMRTISTLPSVIALACSFLATGAGCIGAEPSPEALEAEPIAASAHAIAPSAEVDVTVTEIGPERYIITATTTFDRSAGKIWATIHNFEKLVAAALPGMTSNFEWLDGGSPGKVPSKFQFDVSGTTVVEEVYYRRKANYTMRYRLLEPGLGIIALDGEVKLTPISNKKTRYEASREVTLEPGVIDGFADLIAVETQTLQSHFAKCN